jgi:hypothetical protein
MEILINATVNKNEDSIKTNNYENSLADENRLLKIKVAELEERLKKYTNGNNHKRYYEKNKDKIKESGSNYLQKLKKDNPEKLKEYSRRAYENKKKKLMENTIIQNPENENNDSSVLLRNNNEESLLLINAE